MKANEQPTPETDALIKQWELWNTESPLESAPMTYRDFARKLELERDEARKQRDLWEEDARLRAINTSDAQRERDEAIFQLRLIGDIAVVDWDDTTVGKVDGVLADKEQPTKTYADRVRNLYKRSRDAINAEKERDQLRKVCDELAHSFKQHEDSPYCEIGFSTACEQAYNSLTHVIERNKSKRNYPLRIRELGIDAFGGVLDDWRSWTIISPDSFWELLVLSLRVLPSFFQSKATSWRLFTCKSIKNQRRLA